MILISVNRIRQKFFSNSWNYQHGLDVLDDSCNANLLEHSSRVVKIQLHDSLLHGADFGAVFLSGKGQTGGNGPKIQGMGQMCLYSKALFR